MNRAHISYAKAPRSYADLTQKLIGGCVVLVGVFLGAPYEVFTARQEVSLHTGLLDSMAAVEPALRAVRGEYSGRHFISNYGPLAQWIHGSWAASGPDDVGSVLRWHQLLTTVITNLALWVALATTGAPLSWRAPAYLLWLVLWPFSEILPMLGLLVVILCGYILETARWRIVVYALWALISPLLAAVYFELGVYTFIGLTISVFIAIAWTIRLPGIEARIARGRLVAAGAATFAGVALAMLTAFVPNPFAAYLRDSWEIAKGYSQTMASPAETRYLVLLAAAAVGTVVLAVYFGIRWRASMNEDAASRGRPLGLLGGTCFSLVTLHMALARSDNGHVCLAVSSVVCLTGCLLPCYVRGRNPGANWPALMFWGPASALALWFYLDPLAVQLNAIRKWEPQPAELEVTHRTMRQAIDVAKALPDNQLYVWPFESIVSTAAGKSNPAYISKAYTGHTRYLEEKAIARLQEFPEAPVMYFVKSEPIDGVEHLTRTPRIFRYLVENYAISDSRNAAFLVLRRRAGRPERWHEQELLRPNEIYRPEQDQPLRLTFPADVSAMCRASDLIVIRMSSIQDSWMPSPKPGNLYVTLTLSHGGSRRQRVFLPSDGTVNDILVSACSTDAPAFWSIFHPRRLWRSTTRVVGVELTWEPMDCLSWRPAEITLHRISTLRQDGVEVQTNGLAHSSDPELLDWCYGVGIRN